MATPGSGPAIVGLSGFSLFSYLTQAAIIKAPPRATDNPPVARLQIRRRTDTPARKGILSLSTQRSCDVRGGGLGASAEARCRPEVQNDTGRGLKVSST